MKYKVISHAERLQNSKLHVLKQDCYHRPKKSKVYKDVEVKEGNKIIRDTRLVDYDPIENFEQYNVDMFDLDNMISVGAIESLKFVTSKDNRIDGLLDQIESLNNNL